MAGNNKSPRGKRCTECGEFVPGSRALQGSPQCYRCAPPVERLELLFSQVLPWKIHPYTRVLKHWAPKAKAYHADQLAIRRSVQGDLESMKGIRAIDRDGVGGGLRLGVALFVPPAPTGNYRGGVSPRFGDWDNYFKAIADTLAYGQMIPGDTANILRGPAGVIIPPGWPVGVVTEAGRRVESGVYILPSGIDDQPRTIFSLWRIEEN